MCRNCLLLALSVDATKWFGRSSKLLESNVRAAQAYGGIVVREYVALSLSLFVIVLFSRRIEDDSMLDLSH